MRRLFLPVVASILLTALPVLAEEQRISVNVSEMTCPTCSFTVSSSMRQVPSVEIVEFQESDTFGEGVFMVTYDDAVATPEMIIEAITANGYPAEVLQAGAS